jgi:hypothetical protein
MKRMSAWCLVALAACMVVGGCKKKAEGPKVEVEKIETYKPNLPPVPKVPKLNVAETYSDGSYSVYGVRKAGEKALDLTVVVTGYISKIYEKPNCPPGLRCRIEMPYFYLADNPKETLDKHMIRVVGYAQSFKEMEEQKAIDEDPTKMKELGVDLVPIVWDWRLGQKYRITARFTRQSATGFMEPDGLLDYQKHECLDCPPPTEEELKNAELKAKLKAEYEAKMQ